MSGFKLSQGASLCNLPNEILEQVMRFLHGPLTLYSLVAAHPQAQFVFKKWPNKILVDVVQVGDMPSEIQMLVCATIAVRQHYRQHHSMSTLSLKACLNYYLLSQHSEVGFHPECLTLPMQFLEDYNDICSQIAQAENTFWDYHLSRPISGSQIAEEQQQGQMDSLESEHDAQGPSPAEDYRVSRALCRLWLYFEIFHTLTSLENSRSLGEGLTQRGIFFGRITDWELEEMECVYFHLQYHTDLWRHYCPHCGVDFPPDELPKHNQHRCKQSRSRRKPEKSHPCYDFSDACASYRKNLDTGKKNIIWTDCPAEVDHPNAGFEYLTKHWGKLWDGPVRLSSRTTSVCCYLDWGYCIWDRSWLKKGGFLDRPDPKKPRAVYERWKMRSPCSKGRLCHFSR